MIFFRRSPEFDPNWEWTLPMRFHQWTSGWRGALVLLILIGGGLGWWQGRAFYAQFKEHRAERLLAESDAAHLRGDRAETEEKLRQAIALLGRHPMTLRALARYQVEIHDASVLTTYRELLGTGEATLEDKINFVRTCYRLGRPAQADETLDQLVAEPVAGESPVVMALQAERLAWQGDREAALPLARQAAAGSATGEDAAYPHSVLARLLLQAGPEEQKDGLALLAALAKRPDTAGIEALEMLTTLAQNPQNAVLFAGRRDEVMPLIEAAQTHPQATPALKVAAWNLLSAADPASQAATAEALFAAFKEAPNASEQIEAARWLNQRGLHDRVLELTTPHRMESAEWFLLHLDALAALDRWPEVAALLADKANPPPLSAAVRRLFEFRAATQTGKRVDEAALWRELELATRTDTLPNHLYIAGYLEQLGFPQEAARHYRRVLERNSEPLPAADKLNRPRLLACYTGLLRLAGGSMPLPDLCDLMARFAADFPELDEVQNDNAYLHLLAGKNIEAAAETAQRLLQKKPELLAFRTTAALAAFRQEEKRTQQTPSVLFPHTGPKPFRRAAARIYDGWAIDWTTAQDRYKAVYAAALRAAGRSLEAEQMVQQMDARALRPEERKLAGVK